MIQNQLKPSLGLLDLLFLGVGTIVGVGVFVTAGIVAATVSGPAVMVSFVIAGIAGLLVALCYAEMTACIGGSGGAYTYTTVVFGQSLISTIVGFCALAIYILCIAFLAMGWSGYFIAMLHVVGIALPDFLTHAYYEKGGLANLPAMLIILLIASILMQGNRRGAKLNALLVVSKLGVIFLFVLLAGKHVNTENLQNFMPFGWNGLAKGAAMVFSSYAGFEVLASAAAETKNPQRIVPLSLILTFMISIVLYVIVAIVLTGTESYTLLNNPAAVSNVLIKLHLNWAAGIIAMGALFGITAVIIGYIFIASRLSYSLAVNGLMPKFFSVIHTHNHTPNRAILLCSFLALVLTGFIQFTTAIKYISLGCLIIYIVVCLGVIALRITQPMLARPFRLPLHPLIPILAISSCAYLIFSLY